MATHHIQFWSVTRTFLGQWQFRGEICKAVGCSATLAEASATRRRERERLIEACAVIRVGLPVSNSGVPDQSVVINALEASLLAANIRMLLAGGNGCGVFVGNIPGRKCWYGLVEAGGRVRRDGRDMQSDMAVFW